MSGWDQRYDIESWGEKGPDGPQGPTGPQGPDGVRIDGDLESWAKAIQEEGKSLQRSNKAARYIYLCGMIACLALGWLFNFGVAIGVAVFFALLLAFNEHMIWKLKKAGIK